MYSIESEILITEDDKKEIDIPFIKENCPTNPDIFNFFSKIETKDIIF